MTLVDSLRQRAADDPRGRAFRFLRDDGADEISYAALDQRARGVAAHLQSRGACGERALIVCPPGLDYVVALFGCLYAGWIAVPASDRHIERLAGIVRDATPAVVLTTTETLPKLQPTVDTPCLVLDRLPHDATCAEPHANADDVAILQYTSGATGAPRGVMLSHANLVHNTRQIARRFEIDVQSRGVIWLPPFHDMGLIGGILQGVASGFPIALMSPLAFLRRPVRWLKAITRERATISGGPNFAYDLCVERIRPHEREGLDLSTWQVAFNGAEPVRPATLDRFADMFGAHGFRRAAFYPCYGLAETTLMVSGGDKASAPVLHAGSISCGRPIDDHRLLVVDPDTRTPCAEDTVGEIWTSGPSVARGYWQQPRLTREIFGARLAHSADGPFLRTGDLGYVHHGEVYVTGRLKSVLIVGGQNLHAEDVEHTVVTSHGAGWPGGVAALSIDADGRERLVVLQEVDRRLADLDQAVRAIRLRVAEQHQVPLAAVALLRPGQLPRTTSGKIRRAACRDMFLKRDFEVLAEWP